MKKHLFKILVVLVSAFNSIALEAYNTENIAYQDSQVRFTVITDGVIRLEWHPEGRFVDSPSFVAAERDYPKVDFRISRKGRKVVIKTTAMELSYIKESGKFTADNLEIKATDGFFTWKPGMKQKDNLKGTFRTLDGLEADVQAHTFVVDMKVGQRREFEDGLLARDGWTLIDESENLLFDDSDWAWVKERESGE